MTTYLVHLTGKNFLIDDGKGPKKKCFRSSRLVEAENHKRAEIIALEIVNKDLRNQNSLLNEAFDPPEIVLEGVTEVPAMKYDAQNRAGSIYWENKD